MMIIPHQAADTVFTADRAGKIAVRDNALITISPHQAAYIIITADRAGRIAVRDTAIIIIYPHQAADIFITVDIPDRTAIRDTATIIITHQAADKAASSVYKTAFKSQVLDLAAGSKMPKQTKMTTTGYLHI